MGLAAANYAVGPGRKRRDAEETAAVVEDVKTSPATNWRDFELYHQLQHQKMHAFCVNSIKVNRLPLYTSYNMKKNILKNDLVSVAADRGVIHTTS